MENPGQNTNTTLIPEINLGGLNTDISQLLDDYLNKKKYPPKKFRIQIFQEISRRKIDAVLRKDYKTAEVLTIADNNLHQYYKNERISNKLSKTSHNSRYEPISLCYRLKAVNDDHNEKADQVRSYFKNLREQMQERHKKEIEEFSKKWKSPKALMKFSKPSAQLLQLRQLEKKNAVLNDFVTAQQYKNMADKLEQKETREAYERAEMAMEANGRELLAQHDREKQTLDEREKQRLEDVEVDRKSKSSPISSALKREDDNIRLSPRNRRSSPLLSSCSTAKYRTYLVSKNTESELPTPRTYRKQFNYKSTTTVSQLHIGDLDPESLIKKIEKEKEKREKEKRKIKTAPSSPSSRKARSVI